MLLLFERALDMLEKLRKKDKEKYNQFWNEFGEVLKEGPAEDSANREKIAKLLLYTTTESTDDKEEQGLDDYISRMKEGQEKIYYITAESEKAARTSPHLEIFSKKGIEVVLMFVWRSSRRCLRMRLNIGLRNTGTQASPPRHCWS